MLNDPEFPGTWNDIVCSEPNPYLCEADLGKVHSIEQNISKLTAFKQQVYPKMITYKV